MSTSASESLAPPAQLRGTPEASILKEFTMKIVSIIRRSARAYADAAAMGAMPGLDPMRHRGMQNVIRANRESR